MKGTKKVFFRISNDTQIVDRGLKLQQERQQSKISKFEMSQSDVSDKVGRSGQASLTFCISHFIVFLVTVGRVQGCAVSYWWGRICYLGDIG